VKQYSNTVRKCKCGTPFSTLHGLFHTISPILYFELENDISIKKLLPSLSIDILSSTGKNEYKLACIIYLGAFHFTSRFIIGEKIWTYDGRLQEGCPTPEITDIPINLKSLLTLDNRNATILLYILSNN
jgi:hypothetical protein